MTTPPPFYRPLNPAELTVLSAGGNLFEAGAQVRIACNATFNPDRISRTTFAGEVILRGTPALILDSRLENVTVDGEATIERSRISNYSVGERARIIDAELRYFPGAHHRVNVLSETGGYTITARLGLTIEDAEAEAYGETCPEQVRLTGEIGPDAEVCHPLRIENALIGARARVGYGVVADCAVIDADAAVTDGSMIYHCHVGKGCHIGKGFTAHDSAFFDNCTMECGEAAAVFAGPHAVSCHKSTLLIACRCSFFNAGSGTNMSNHAYRLGPVHHGEFKRGCKTASNAYVLWPATFGAYSLIVGSHKGHPDTSALPFSYVIEQNGKQTLMPGMVIKTAGLLRDLAKWPERDRRKDAEPIDCRHLTPEMVETLERGITLLERMDGDTKWHGYQISAGMAKRGASLYRLLLDSRSDAHARRRLLEMAKADAMLDFMESTERSLGRPEDNAFIASIVAEQARLDDDARTDL